MGMETVLKDLFTKSSLTLPVAHEAPEDIEAYLCIPPLMNQAVEKMADDFGIPPENVVSTTLRLSKKVVV